MSHWVQHISGQGAKWEVESYGHLTSAWGVKGTGPDVLTLYLPTSEYRLCEPPTLPETWTDVTAHCRFHEARNVPHGWRLSYRALYPGSNWQTQECYILEHSREGASHLYPFAAGYEPTQAAIDRVVAAHTKTTPP